MQTTYGGHTLIRDHIPAAISAIQHAGMARAHAKNTIAHVLQEALTEDRLLSAREIGLLAVEHLDHQQRTFYKTILQPAFVDEVRTIIEVWWEDVALRCDWGKGGEYPGCCQPAFFEFRQARRFRPLCKRHAVLAMESGFPATIRSLNEGNPR